jgi:phospholipase/carboxylesterase
VSGHQKRVLKAGADIRGAAGLLLMVHGRGASAEDILSLAPNLDAEGFAYWAPQATNATWYPYPFLVPTERNEPWLSSALALLADLTAEATALGMPREKIRLVGFSQGACLSLEFAARNAARWGGVAAFSGGLIGDRVERKRYAGDFAGTPVFIGCSDTDMHIPAERVRESAQLMADLNAAVMERIYPGMAHTITDGELAEANAHLFPQRGE